MRGYGYVLVTTYHKHQAAEKRREPRIMRAKKAQRESATNDANANRQKDKSDHRTVRVRRRGRQRAGIADQRVRKQNRAGHQKSRSTQLRC